MATFKSLRGEFINVEVLDKGAATVECEVEFRIGNGSFEDASGGCFVEEDYVVCWRLVRIEWGGYNRVLEWN